MQPRAGLSLQRRPVTHLKRARSDVPHVPSGYVARTRSPGAQKTVEQVEPPAHPCGQRVSDESNNVGARRRDTRVEPRDESITQPPRGAARSRGVGATRDTSSRGRKEESTVARCVYPTRRLVATTLQRSSVCFACSSLCSYELDTILSGTVPLVWAESPWIAGK